MNTGEVLLKAFVEHAREPALDVAERVQTKLAEMYQSGAQRWPGFVLAPESFGAHLGERLVREKDPLEALNEIYGDDLYLACAVLGGIPQAIEWFERRLLARVNLFVSHVDSSTEFVDEVKQEMRIKLLLARPETSPKLAFYSGRGALEQWMRAVAGHIALDLVRRRRPSSHKEDAELELLPASENPELEALRREHRHAFRLALEAAIMELEQRERTLLRLHYLENVTFQGLGQIYDKHETTTLRWVEQAKATILASVRRRLRNDLRLSENAMNELSSMIQSQLDLSLERMLSSSST
jgi:RNA polymerase sigma-70 factor (ECF subfamily)